MNDKTVNYIVKYMTKPDLDNPEYKGEHNKTDETYRFRDGSLAALPKY